jgi:hypothetical protein
MKPNWPVPPALNSMRLGSTRSMASRSQPLIATIRHRPVIRALDFGTPLAMRRQSSDLGGIDRFEVPSFDRAPENRQYVRLEVVRVRRGYVATSGKAIQDGGRIDAQVFADPCERSPRHRNRSRPPRSSMQPCSSRSNSMKSRTSHQNRVQHRGVAALEHELTNTACHRRNLLPAWELLGWPHADLTGSLQREQARDHTGRGERGRQAIRQEAGLLREQSAAGWTMIEHESRSPWVSAVSGARLPGSGKRGLAPSAVTDIVAEAEAMPSSLIEGTGSRPSDGG